MINRRNVVLSAGISIFGMHGSAYAKDYPAKQPIKLVVGYPPGGPSDILARIIADHLVRELGQAIVVDNRAGAGGMVGATNVAGQRADGYTLMFDTESISSRGAAIYKKLPYDPVKDFTRIDKLVRQRSALVVHPSVPVSSVAELIQYAKGHPGKLNYGCAFGSSSHMGGALFNHLNQVDISAINYKGGSQLVTDLMANIVQVGFYAESTVAQQVKAGSLRTLAVVANDKSVLFPELPTMKEAGAAPMDISAWGGVIAPAGLPQPIVDRLHQAMQKIVADPNFASQLQPIGASPILNSSPVKYTQDVSTEMNYWKKMVADAGIQQAE